MTVTQTDIGAENECLVRVLACAVENAGKPRGRIADDAGMHRQTLMKLVRGERVIKLEDAVRILDACGVPVRSSLMLPPYAAYHSSGSRHGLPDGVAIIQLFLCRAAV